MLTANYHNTSIAAQAAWPLLFLTAALQVYDGLSSVAYVFMGVSSPASGLGRWAVVATGGLQAAAGAAAIVLAARRDLRGATLAVAGGIMLGWLSTLVFVAERGLFFRGDDRMSTVYFVVSPLVAIAAAALAWRNPYPVAAALVVSAMTFAGILAVIGFSIVIAIHGF